jgi:hypothetical protein
MPDVSHIISQLQGLAAQQEANVKGLLEHLDLAQTLAAGDERIVSFIAHLKDEEVERLEALASIQQQLQSFGGAAAAAPVAVAAVVSPEGWRHEKLRDETVLTVGSLIGCAQ